MEWRNWKYIITVIFNEDWTYKDKSEIIDEMLMESIMKRIVFIGEGRIKSGPAINSSNSFILLFLMGRMIELMNCLRRRPAQENSPMNEMKKKSYFSFEWNEDDWLKWNWAASSIKLMKSICIAEWMVICFQSSSHIQSISLHSILFIN